MVRTAVVGATGYGGRELVRLLSFHPNAELVAVTSTSQVGESLAESLAGFGGLSDLVFETFDAAALAGRCDVVFIGVPSGESALLAKELRAEGLRVIDIGADFRLKDTAVYSQYYGLEHAAPELLPDAVYGLPAFYRDAIRDAKLVAVPGCYPISALIPLRPLAQTTAFEVPVIIDAISGVSGAGRTPKQPFHLPEMDGNVWAYKVGTHQHTPEIEQELGGKVTVQFTPHVGPYSRGILTTITARLSEKVDLDALYRCYDDETFVRVLGAGALPQIAHVRASNYCDFGWVEDARTGNLILVSAVDNLFGGTAGPAIQCMNLMFGLDESEGVGGAGIAV